MLRTALLAALSGFVSTAALAFPQLPLKEGEFTRGHCETNPTPRIPSTDVTESIGVYTVLDVAKPYQFISPMAEDQTGYCMVKKFKTSGQNVSGKTSCVEGKGDFPSGNYIFNYRILNSTAFVSRGVTYKWCAPHR